jgi:predicted DNA-binding transcriptional regulator AlpA
MREKYSLQLLCKVLNVKENTYYKHIKRKPRWFDVENAALSETLAEIHRNATEPLSIHKIRELLAEKHGKKVAIGRIYRLMENLQLPRLKEIEMDAIKKDIREIYESANEPIGAHKVREILLEKYGKSASITRVYRLMNALEIPKVSDARAKAKLERQKKADADN